jgi:hypothetical protein
MTLDSPSAKLNDSFKANAVQTYESLMSTVENEMREAKKLDRPISDAYFTAMGRILDNPQLRTLYPGIDIDRASVVFPSMSSNYNLLAHENKIVTGNYEQDMASLEKYEDQVSLEWEKSYKEALGVAQGGDIKFVPGISERFHVDSDNIAQQRLYLEARIAAAAKKAAEEQKKAVKQEGTVTKFFKGLKQTISGPQQPQE